MDIPKTNVWVTAAHEAGKSTTNLGRDDEAPPTFDSEAAIADYVQNNYEAGEYHILRISDTVEVTEQDEMYSNYTDEDMDTIEQAVDILNDEDRVVSARTVDDPSGRDQQLSNYGVELKASPYTLDVLVEVNNETDDSVEAVGDWVQARVAELRVVGKKRSTYYEQRGDRGTSTVLVGLTLDVGPSIGLVEQIQTEERAVFTMPANDLLFVSRASPNSRQPDQVIVTDVGLETETSMIGDDPTPQQVLNAVSEELAEFGERLNAETGWGVTDYGFVTSTEDEAFYLLAIGVTHTDIP